MTNPWLSLPDHAPYMLQTDAQAINRHNETASTATFIHADLLPEPFIGRLDAPIVTLMTNPGWDPIDRLIYESEYAKQVYRANLEQGTLEYPFYMIDPTFVANQDPSIPRGRHKAGPFWWLNTLKHLIDATDRKTVAHNILNIEYFPYHSQKNPLLKSSLESQHFGFEQVRQAMDRQALILVSRNLVHWYKAVPGLYEYTHRHERAPRMQSAMITRKIHPTGFLAALEVLQRA